MFKNRWRIAWFAIWLVGTAVWAVVVLAVAIDDWARLPTRHFGIAALPMFFLTFFTLPVLAAYGGGLVLGSIVIRLPRLLFGWMRHLLRTPRFFADVRRRMTT